jgi:hypothetical protein
MTCESPEMRFAKTRVAAMVSPSRMDSVMRVRPSPRCHAFACSSTSMATMILGRLTITAEPCHCQDRPGADEEGYALAAAPQPRAAATIVLAWTAWQHALRRLVAAVVVGSRAITVAIAVFQQTTSVRSPTTWKHKWLQLLVHTRCDTGQSAVMLCVRGLRRARWL